MELLNQALASIVDASEQARLSDQTDIAIKLDRAASKLRTAIVQCGRVATKSPYGNGACLLCNYTPKCRCEWVSL